MSSASNKTEGTPAKGGHSCKYAQDFERGTGALESTSYSRMQNGIQSENKSKLSKSKARLKQD